MSRKIIKRHTHILINRMWKQVKSRARTAYGVSRDLVSEILLLYVRGSRTGRKNDTPMCLYYYIYTLSGI